MSAAFEELAWADTPMGLVSLRRRREPSRQVDVYEVRLDDEFLMSSLFTVAEQALAHLTLGRGESSSTVYVAQLGRHGDAANDGMA